MPPVRKTSLYVDDQVDRALQRRAEREGISKAEVIRRALAAAAEQAPDPPLSFIGTLDFAPVPVEGLDEELERTGFGT